MLNATSLYSVVYFYCRRVALELDPLLPVARALHSIETGVDRLAKLVEKKVG